MTRSTVLGATLVAVALLAAPRAHAQAGDAYRRAVVLFEQSESAYRAGNFARAASLLRAAYALRPEPVLQYNLARSLEGLGDLAGAIEAYEAYLAGSATAADRASVERRVATLRAQQARRAELEQQRAALEAARLAERQARERAEASLRARGAAPSPVGPRLAGPLAVGGLGLAGVAAGAVVGGLALATHRDADAAPVQRDAFALQQTAQGEALAANVAFVAGGVVVAAGAAWLLGEVLAANRRAARARAETAPR